MLSIKEYMRNTGTSKKKYVLSWVEKGLIPGVTTCEETGELLFPDSARRPYIARCAVGADAKTIRASIVNACLKRQHITPETFLVSEGEFQGFIDDLVKAELIVKRNEDGITYYDSTTKCDDYKGQSFSKLATFVNNCLKIIEKVEPVISIAAGIATISTII